MDGSESAKHCGALEVLEEVGSVFGSIFHLRDSDTDIQDILVCGNDVVGSFFAVVQYEVDVSLGVVFRRWSVPRDDGGDGFPSVDFDVITDGDVQGTNAVGGGLKLSKTLRVGSDLAHPFVSRGGANVSGVVCLFHTIVFLGLRCEYSAFFLNQILFL